MICPGFTAGAWEVGCCAAHFTSNFHRCASNSLVQIASLYRNRSSTVEETQLCLGLWGCKGSLLKARPGKCKMQPSKHNAQHQCQPHGACR